MCGCSKKSQAATSEAAEETSPTARRNDARGWSDLLGNWLQRLQVGVGKRNPKSKESQTNTKEEKGIEKGNHRTTLLDSRVDAIYITNTEG